MHEDNDLRKYFYSTIGELSSSTNPQAAEILKTLLQNIGTRDEARQALSVADKVNLKAKKTASEERNYNEGPLADRFEDSFTPDNKRRLT